MPNTDLCLSCENGQRTKTVNILGKPVTVKSYICSADGVNYPQKPDNIRLQLSVCPTSFCPGNCPFCIAGGTASKQKIDLNKFEKVMRLLKQEDRVRGVKITGGEPFYDVALLNETVEILYGVFGLELEVSVSTNGIWLDRLHEIKKLRYIDAIHISRHHYDDEINRALFGGAPVPSGEKLKEIIDTVSFKDIFVINCMLLKDYINSKEEAHRFLDFAISIGAPKVGFMICTPINEFAKAQTIPYDTVLRDDDPALLFTRGFYDYEYCSCRDGVYASDDGSIIEFYGRSTNTNTYAYSRGLVYDADDHLRDGFGGNIII